MLTTRTRIVAAMLTAVCLRIFPQLGDKVNKDVSVDKTDEVYCVETKYLYNFVEQERLIIPIVTSE